MKRNLLTVLIMISLLTGGCGTLSAAPANVEAIAAETKEPAKEEPAKEEPAKEGSKTEQTKTEVSGTVTPSAVPTEEPQEDYRTERTGRYYLSSIVQGGVLMNTEKVAQVESYGVEMLLDLEEDGSGVMKVFGEEWEFTWDEDELTFEQETSSYLWSEQAGISFAKEKTAYLFTKEKASDVIKAEKAAEQARRKQTAEETQKLPEEEKEEGSSEPPEEIMITARFIGADWVQLEGSYRKGLCVWYEFTNGTKETISPYYLEASITQDGNTAAEGDAVLSEKEKIAENDFRFTEVLPGGTNRSIHLFDADQNGGTIQYSIRVNGKEILNTELDPGDLPGRPQDDFQPEAVLDLDYLDRIPAKGIYDELYELSIQTATVIDPDAEATGLESEDLRMESEEEQTVEKRYLRVKFEFKNGSDEAVSPYLVLYLRAVQDGISLNPARSSKEDPDLDLIYKDVKPGKSSEFYYEWQLITDSPVAVEAYDWFSRETVLGRAFEVK